MAVKECLQAAAANVEWEKLPARWTDEAGNLCGKGIACFNKLTGTPSTTSVMVKMNENGSVYIMAGSTEMGQGVTTTLPQIAAQALSMDLEKVSMAPVDTAMTPFDKTTTSSRSTFHAGNAILEACEDIKAQLCRLAAIRFGVPEADVTYTADGYIQSLSQPEKRIHINDVERFQDHARAARRWWLWAAMAPPTSLIRRRWTAGSPAVPPSCGCTALRPPWWLWIPGAATYR